MLLRTVRELNVGEITPSSMTLTLTDSYVTQPVSILRNVLVHVNRLAFPMDFLVPDTKGTSRGYVILEWSFLETRKAKIYVETNELILKVNKKKLVFKVYDRVKRSWIFAIIWRKEIVRWTQDKEEANLSM